MMTRSMWLSRAACSPLVAVFGMSELELVVEGKLLDQRLAQIGIVVDEKDLAGCHLGLSCLWRRD